MRAPARVALTLILAAGVALLPSTVAQAPAGKPLRILIDKDAAYDREASHLARGGMLVLADYGSFVLAEIPQGRRGPLLSASGVRVRREIPEGVRMRRRALSETSIPRAAAVSGLHLVRFAGPPRPAWVESLRSLPGARVLMALPEGAYVIWLPEEARRGISSLTAPIDLVTPLPAIDRLSPELDLLPGPLDVTLLFVDTPEGAAAAAAAVDRAVRRPSASSRLPGLIARTLTLTRESFDEISSWPELVWAEPWVPAVRHDELSALLTAGLAAAGRPLSPQYREWLSFHGLDDLSAYVVQIVDTGIDTGRLGAEHPALAGRLAFSLDETEEGSLEDCLGHGTHLAGIVAGNPPSSIDLKDASGYSIGLGVAPTARVGSSRIFDCDGNNRLRRSLGEIFTDAWNRGARISNDSWGTGGANYDVLAREFDGLVRDVDADSSNGDQPMVIVASVGNRGSRGAYTIDSPGLAKNVIGVGGSESFRPEGTDGCGVGPLGADDADQVRDSSSRGPTNDGRIKPDLVAPASHIFSLVSQSRRYSGAGLCDSFYPAGQRLYTWTGGSSQATAHVSGAAVLAMADYQRTHGSAPSPAMIKAGMIAAAHDLGGAPTPAGGVQPHRPGPDQGWGKIDLSALVGRRYRETFDQSEIFTGPGQEITKGPFHPADPNQPVTIVLAWTDAPGTPAGSSWVNDLDLEVKSGATAWFGNNLDGSGASIPGGAHDGRNNLEVVHLVPPLPPVFTVRVLAVSVPGDGVPSHPGLTDQDFALYVDNVVGVESRGRILLDRAAYACGTEAVVTVSDGNLTGGGRVRIEATSPTEATPEEVELDEDPPGSGVFRGGISLRSGAASGDGILQVADGDVFTVGYGDTDTGAGDPDTVRASATALCSPLIVSDVRPERVGTDQALMTWRTDRPADSVVLGARGPFGADPTPVREHRVLLTGLSDCTSYSFHVSSTDQAGATTVFPATGSIAFSTGSGRRISILSEDFESGAGRWTHDGPDDEWELGEPTSGPMRAISGARAWGTRLSGPYSATADMALTSPPIDLRGVTNPILSFGQYYDLPLSSSPGGPQDGAWVEISTDDGVNWTPIAPVAGYPSNQGSDNPFLPPGSGVYASSSRGWESESFDLSIFEGHVVRLRFRLWRDPSSISAPGTGWYIDDVIVSALVPCHRATLVIDAPVYGCSQIARVTLSDSDLNRDPLRRDIASAIATSPEGSIGLLLNETSRDSAMFTGAIPLTALGAPGKLRVAPGDTFSVRYNDLDDGSGASTVVQVDGSVPDCTSPAPPSNFKVEPDGTGRLRLQWQDPPESDLAEIRIHYDSDASGPAYTGEGAAEGLSPVRAEGREEQTVLSGLPACVPMYLALTAVDQLGNESPFSAEDVGVPAGPSSCVRAALSLTPSGEIGCEETVLVTVADGNADADPNHPGVITASASSPSDPSPIPITLIETSASSGRFVGSLALARTPAPGRLGVAAGDTVDVAYLDADTGGGGNVTFHRALPVVDCTPPVIANVRVDALGFNDVRVVWETDEPSSSYVSYGLAPSLGRTAVGSSSSTHHKVTLTGLAACATFYFRITSRDSHGNVSVADDGGAPFHDSGARSVVSFFDDLESGASGWSHGGIFDDWQLGTPLDGPPQPPSGTHVWGINLAGPYRRGADEYLTSPEIDLSGIESATLTFKQWYDIFTSDPGQGLDDGGWVEVSRDGGATWTYITPEGGYPDVVANNSDIPFSTPVYAGTTAAWEEAVFHLDAFAGGSIRIRFHLFQDAIDALNVPGLGWYIDDVKIVAAAACHRGRLRLDAAGRDCGGPPIELRLWDADLNTDPASEQIATAQLTSPSDPIPMDVSLAETGPDTGIFIGHAPFGSAGGPGILRVSEGDVVAATYDDADDGTGAPSSSTDLTRIVDCTPPTITGVRARPLSVDSALVEWETGEPASSEVTIQPGGALFGDAARVTSHAVTITGLSPCTAYRFQVASADRGGSRSIADNGGSLFGLDAERDVLVLSEGFEAGAAGWSHGGVHDLWQIGPPISGPGSAYEGAAVAATNLSGNYQKDRLRQRTESFLVSPWFSLKGASQASLTIHHFYAFARDTSGDGAMVEAWDGNEWALLTPDGGYPGGVHRDRSEGVDPAFTELSGGYLTSRFDLSALIGRSTRLRFRVILDNGTPASAAGWYLDGIRVAALTPCRRGLLTLDRDAYSCGPLDARLTLADTDLDTDLSSAETVQLQMSVAGNAVPLTLTETGAATGTFTGTLSLAPSPSGSSLVVHEGDVLQASYFDADDGSGTSRIASASAGVTDCAAPAISRIDVSRVDDGTTVRARWLTNEPATTEATLSSSPTAPIESVSEGSLTTDHVVLFPGLPDCAPYNLAIGSADAAGNRASQGGIDAPFSGETIRRRILFRDDMEGSDPGWGLSGIRVEWERGFPAIGPPGAFSGSSVWGTDLDGRYEIGCDQTLTSPPIDLTHVASARLTFWHYYGIFADRSPNAEDDGAWVEIGSPAQVTTVYLEPVGGYPNTIDRDGHPPIVPGSGVYSGSSGGWRKAEFDLSRFAGGSIILRFRLWNDVLGQATGVGWYVDDVEVTAPEACSPPPSLRSASAGRLTQGATGVPIEIAGGGFRSPVVLDAGAGLSFRSIQVIAPDRVDALVDVEETAAALAHDFRLVNPDGQSATLASAFVVTFDAARSDVDGSGGVDGADLAILARSFGAFAGEPRYRIEADLNGDGVVDGVDLALLAARFGAATGP